MLQEIALLELASYLVGGLICMYVAIGAIAVLVNYPGRLLAALLLLLGVGFMILVVR